MHNISLIFFFFFIKPVRSRTPRTRKPPPTTTLSSSIATHSPKNDDFTAATCGLVSRTHVYTL